MERNKDKEIKTQNLYTV